MNIPSQFNMLNTKGWECPKCNAVMSPNYPTCFYCKPTINNLDQLEQDLSKLKMQTAKGTL